MLKLIDLLTMYQIKASSIDNLALLTDIASGVGFDSRINTTTLNYLILKECGDLEPRHTTTDVFKVLSIQWWKSRKEQIAHLLDALATSYKPFEDFRWHEEGERDIADDFDAEHNTTDSIVTTDDVTVEHKVSADNEAYYQPRDTTTTDDDATSNETGKLTKDENRKTDDDHTLDRYGHNASNQKNALDEVEVAQYNIYQMLVDWYSQAFFVQVW